MTIEDAMGALLKSSAVCLEDGTGDAFYVSVPGQRSEAKDASCCILLSELLHAPRQMPLECLISGTHEECALYAQELQPYKDRRVETELADRLPWLLGLLGVLSVSSGILEFYDALLQRHLIIAFYVTALIGCAGNAGSQSSSLVLQALASGEIVPGNADISWVLQKELLVSLGLAAALALGVATRILVFGGSLADAGVIAAAMAATVVISVVFSAVAPLALQRLGAEPAKVCGPLLSTVTDIVGVLIVCWCVCLLEAAGVFA